MEVGLERGEGKWVEGEEEKITGKRDALRKKLTIIVHSKY